jgi:hypothetical protein
MATKWTQSGITNCLYMVRQVSSYSEQRTHVQNFDTGRIILERYWTDEVTDPE